MHACMHGRTWRKRMRRPSRPRVVAVDSDTRRTAARLPPPPPSVALWALAVPGQSVSMILPVVSTAAFTYVRILLQVLFRLEPCTMQFKGADWWCCTGGTLQKWWDGKRLRKAGPPPFSSRDWMVLPGFQSSVSLRWQCLHCMASIPRERRTTVLHTAYGCSSVCRCSAIWLVSTSLGHSRKRQEETHQRRQSKATSASASALFASRHHMHGPLSRNRTSKLKSMSLAFYRYTEPHACLGQPAASSRSINISCCIWNI